MSDAAAIYAAVMAVVFVVAGFDLGIAFLMRGQREAGAETRD